MALPTDQQSSQVGTYEKILTIAKPHYERRRNYKRKKQSS